MLNIELLREAVEWVEWQDGLDLEKRQWDQGVWYVDLDVARAEGDDGRALYSDIAEKRPECGTACCFAGYVAETVHGADKLKAAYAEGSRDLARVDWLAREALGLAGQPLEVHSLYDKITDGDNKAEDIRRHAEALADYFGMTL